MIGRLLEKKQIVFDYKDSIRRKDYSMCIYVAV